MRALLASLVLLVMVVAGPTVVMVLAARQAQLLQRGPQLAWHGDTLVMVRLAAAGVNGR